MSTTAACISSKELVNQSRRAGALSPLRLGLKERGLYMRATRKQIAEANRIAARFGGWREPEEIRAMYEALEAVGITTGVITNRRDFPNLGCWQGSCEWYINGEEVENSRFIYSVYEGNPNITKNDYNIYFS